MAAVTMELSEEDALREQLQAALITHQTKEARQREALASEEAKALHELQSEWKALEEGETEPIRVECVLRDGMLSVVRAVELPLAPTVHEIQNRVQEVFNMRVTLRFRKDDPYRNRIVPKEGEAAGEGGEGEGEGGEPEPEPEEEGGEDEDEEEGGGSKKKGPPRPNIRKSSVDWEAEARPWRKPPAGVEHTGTAGDASVLTDENLYIYLGIPRSLWRKHRRFTRLIRTQPGRLIARPMFMGLPLKPKPLRRKEEHPLWKDRIGDMQKRQKELSMIHKANAEAPVLIACYENAPKTKPIAKLAKFTPTKPLRSEVDDVIAKVDKKKKENQLTEEKQAEQLDRVFRLALLKHSDFRRKAELRREAEFPKPKKLTTEEMGELEARLVTLAAVKLKTKEDKRLKQLDNMRGKNPHKKLNQEEQDEIIARVHELEIKRRKATIKNLTRKVENESSIGPKEMKLKREDMEESNARLYKAGALHKERKQRDLFKKYVLSEQPVYRKLRKDEQVNSAERLHARKKMMM